MVQFNLSNAPLSTLFPDSSPQKDPNYNNVFQIDFSNLKNTTSPMPDYAKQFKNNTNSTLNQMKFKAGLASSSSSNSAIAFKGKQMADEAVNYLKDNNKQFSQLFPTNGSKKPFIDKFNNSTFGKNYDLWNSGLNTASNLFTSIAGEKSEYDGEYGNVARTADNIYDTIQGVAGAIPGIGQIISLGMGANKLLGNVANKLGAGTDGMTVQDSILGSAFFQLSPLGLINGIFGQRADTITRNDEAFATVGSSYTGTDATVNDALTKSGKKYGLFSSGARKDANNEIWEAKRQQNVMANIADAATDRFNIVGSMSAINGNRRQFYLQGGYNQADVRVGRSGMSLELINKAKDLLKEINTKESFIDLVQPDTIEQFKDGGQISTYIELVPEDTIEQFQDGGTLLIQKPPYEDWIQHVLSDRINTNYDLKKAYEVLPFEMLENWRKASDEDLKTSDKNHLLSIYELPNGDYEFLKLGTEETNPEVHFETDTYYSGQNGLKETHDLIFDKDKNRYYYKRKTEKFQEGGSINVIPEGALHARLHHMDIEGITQKGIPVVAENKDGEIEQQAEVEKNEIILRLEVTKKLEELQKLFYDENTSDKDKEQAALEAGKLLVDEILYNTQDNTGLINEVQ